MTVDASPAMSCEFDVLDGNSGRSSTVVAATGRTRSMLAIPNAKLWSPDDPHLYELRGRTARRRAKSSTRSTATSACGRSKSRKMPTASIGCGSTTKSLFQYGPLDQGWWPDGLYTAPTDEALKYDIEMTKKFGMNMIRKHVKVEPARWYYWCDKLGILVWQDMVSGDAHKTDESKANYRNELKAMIDALRNHPSIVMWVPFNEGWGQHDTPEVAEWVKKYDPSRPVNEASGWTDKGSGDVSDMHSYPGPGMREPEDESRRRARRIRRPGNAGEGAHVAAGKELGLCVVRQQGKTYRRLCRAADGDAAARRPRTVGGGLHADDRCRDRSQRPHDVRPRSREDGPAADQSGGCKAVLAAAEDRRSWFRRAKSRRRPGVTRRRSRTTAWFEPGFNDGQWKTGPAGFGVEGTTGAVCAHEVGLARYLAAPHVRC